MVFFSVTPLISVEAVILTDSVVELERYSLLPSNLTVTVYFPTGAYALIVA